MAKLNVSGASLEFVERGQDEKIVLVHGSASDYRTWQAQLDEFGKNFRAIAYSRRYHWPNDPIPENADYSMLEHVDDLQGVLRYTGTEPVHLVGHSYGALVCLLLACRKPGLIQTLVLAEPPAITLFVSSKPRPIELLSLLVKRPRTAMSIIKFGARGVAPATAAIKKGDREKALSIFGPASIGLETFRNLSEARLKQVRDNLIKAEFTGSGYTPLDDNQMRNVRIPTLLLNAHNSPKLYHHLVDRLEELLPDTERLVIPGASHLMHEDNPSAFNEEVLSFIKKHGDVR
jgi:pimeloyl-ACP methyl ester carboxylesterase